jgi:hypothetical protein
VGGLARKAAAGRAGGGDGGVPRVDEALRVVPGRARQDRELAAPTRKHYASTAG